jgi:hypothetical protein
MSASSKLDMPRGLAIAAVAAWALSWLTDVGGFALLACAGPLFGRPVELPIDQLAGFTWMYVIVGLPVALVLCLALGWPLWIALERRGVRGARNAALTGAAFGLSLALVVQGVGLFYGAQIALDENASSETSIYGYRIIRDGLPTALGWVFNALDTLVTASIGAVAGLTAWRFAQRPTAPPQAS